MSLPRSAAIAHVVLIVACGAFGSGSDATPSPVDAGPSAAESGVDAGAADGNVVPLDPDAGRLPDGGLRFCARRTGYALCDDFEDLAAFGARWDKPFTTDAMNLRLENAEAFEGAGALRATFTASAGSTLDENSGQLSKTLDAPDGDITVELDLRTKAMPNNSVMAGVLHYEHKKNKLGPALIFGHNGSKGIVACEDAEIVGDDTAQPYTDTWIHMKLHVLFKNSNEDVELTLSTTPADVAAVKTFTHSCKYPGAADRGTKVRADVGLYTFQAASDADVLVDNVVITAR